MSLPGSGGGSSSEQVRTGLPVLVTRCHFRGVPQVTSLNRSLDLTTRCLWCGRHRLNVQGVPGLMSRGHSTVRSRTLWVMVTWRPPPEQNDKQTAVKNYLLATSLAGGIHTASKPRPTLILIRCCTDFTSIKCWSVSVPVNAPFKIMHFFIMNKIYFEYITSVAQLQLVNKFALLELPKTNSCLSATSHFSLKC